jgi:4-amino-4-deoxy-L-arabinose transferase-like glycosyltransferase
MNIVTKAFASGFGAVQEKQYRGLLMLLLLSLGWKLALWGTLLTMDPGRFLDRDSASYHEPARALLQLGRFVASPETPELVETMRTPGYPLFLAGVYLVWGEYQPMAILVQILLSLGTMALVYRIACMLWNTGTALLATLLLALDITSFTYALKLMSETLFTLLLIAMVVAGIYLIKSPRKLHWAFLVGVLLAAATFVRPISYYLLVPLVLLYLGIGITQRWRRSQLLLAMALLVLPFLLLIGGWQVRNYLLTGSAQYSSVEGVNLLYRRGAAIVALQEDMDLQEARSQLWEESKPQEEPLPRRWTAVDDARWKQEGMALIWRHPLLFIRSQLPGAVLLMATPGEGELLRMLGLPIGEIRSPLDYLNRFHMPLAVFMSLFALLYLAIVYCGLLSWWWHRLRNWRFSSIHLFTWIVVLYFVAVSAGQGYSRFRVPIMPILVLYAAHGLHQLWLARRGANGLQAVETNVK